MSKIPKELVIEKALTNSVFSEDTFSKAKTLIDSDFSPISDMRASKDYRVMCKKFDCIFYEVNVKKFEGQFMKNEQLFSTNLIHESSKNMLQVL